LREIFQGRKSSQVSVALGHASILASRDIGQDTRGRERVLFFLIFWYYFVFLQYIIDVEKTMSGIDITTSKKSEKYLFTIKGIRARNFSRNLPFLILSDKLPDGQVYREFPDGHIEVQQVFVLGPKFQYKALKTLPAAEADTVRKAYGLPQALPH